MVCLANRKIKVLPGVDPTDSRSTKLYKFTFKLRGYVRKTNAT